MPFEPLHKDMLLCVVPKTFKKKAPLDAITFEEIKHTPFIMLQETVDADIRDYLKKHHITYSSNCHIEDDLSALVMVENGFKSVMEENDINVMDSFHADGWRAELAGKYTLNHMEMIKSADAIMCGNDNLASQIVPVLAQNRIAGKVLVVGHDADLEACQRIVEGTQLMTVYKPVDLLAKRAAEYAISFAKGENIGETSFINDGTYDVKYVSLAPISVTKEDMEEVIIKNGFHSREDVYLNIPNKDE